ALPALDGDRAVGVEERQREPVGQVDGHEPRRQRAGGDLLAAGGVAIGPARRVAPGEAPAGGVQVALADRGEAVVGGDEDVGAGGQVRVALEVVEDLPEVVVRVADGRPGRRAIDAGYEGAEAISLVVLGSVRIARPLDENEASL